MSAGDAAAMFDRRTGRQAGSPERLLDRHDQLEELRALWAGALPAHPAWVVIVGGWGTGKTALLNAAGRLARDSGRTWVSVRARRAERHPRFAAARELVEGLSRALAEAADDASVHARGVLLTMSRPQVAPEDVAESVVEWLGEHGGAPVVFAVDDVDLADDGSVTVLQSVVRRLGPPRATLLMTSSPRRSGTALHGIDWLLADAGCRVLHVGLLPRPVVDAEIRAFADGDVDDRFLDAVWQATAGRPLFLFKLLTVIAVQRRPFDAATGARLGDEVVPAVTSQVVARLAGLPAGTADLLQAVAVLGDEADLSLARELAGLDHHTAGLAAEAATSAELLEAGHPLRFVSPLVRSALHHEVPSARRSQLHADAARMLRARGVGSRPMCSHLLLTDAGDDPTVAAALHECGRAAARDGDGAWACRCLERALAEPPDHDQLAEILLDLVAVELQLGSPRAVAHLLRAVHLDVAEPDRLARLAAGALRRAWGPVGPGREVLDRLRALLAQVDPNATDIRLDLLLGLSHAEGACAPGDLAAMQALATALGTRRSVAARDARAFLAQHRVGSTPGLADELEVVFDPAAIVGDDAVSSAVQLGTAMALLCRGRFGVDDVLQSVVSEAARGGRRPLQRAALALLALSALWQGALDTAHRCAEEVLSAPDGVEGWAGRLAQACLPAVLLEKGAVAAAMTLAPADRRDPPVVADVELGAGASSPKPSLADTVAEMLVGETRARLQLAAGHPSEAQAILSDVAARAEALGVDDPAITSWRVLAAAAADRPERAEAAVDAHLMLARRFGQARILGAALRAAAALARGEERLQLLRESAAVLDRSPAKLEMAKTQLSLGRALLAGRQQGEARAALRQAAHLASLCGADGLVESAAQELRASGSRPRRMAMTGWEALTPAEARTAAMAASGTTNGAIARSLYVSEKTVEGHLARVYRKLGICSRLELPAAATLQPDGSRPRRTAGPGADGRSAVATASDQVGPQLLERYGQ